MLFNEKQMLDICKKYGIDVVEHEGYPLYMGEEMNENFSFSEMMYQPIEIVDNSVIYSSESIQLSIPVFMDKTPSCNFYCSDVKKDLFYKKESSEDKRLSSIPYDNQNKYAA